MNALHYIVMCLIHDVPVAEGKNKYYLFESRYKINYETQYNVFANEIKINGREFVSLFSIALPSALISHLSTGPGPLEYILRGKMTPVCSFRWLTTLFSYAAGQQTLKIGIQYRL